MPLADHGFYSLTDESFKAQDVRYWPSLAAPHMSAFGGKADMAFCGISLSRLGVKQT